MVDVMNEKPADGNYQNLPYICQSCFTMKVGRWPHPEGEQCPATQARDAAYIAKLEAERDAAIAQREYYERAGMPMLDMAEMARAMTNMFKKEDDE